MPQYSSLCNEEDLFVEQVLEEEQNPQFDLVGIIVHFVLPLVLVQQTNPLHYIKRNIGAKQAKAIISIFDIREAIHGGSTADNSKMNSPSKRAISSSTICLL